MTKGATHVYHISEKSVSLIIGLCDTVLFPWARSRSEQKKKRSLCIKYVRCGKDKNTSKPACVLEVYSGCSECHELTRKKADRIVVAVLGRTTQIKGFPGFAVHVDSILPGQVTINAYRKPF